jgi:hypothetical protein
MMQINLELEEEVKPYHRSNVCIAKIKGMDYQMIYNKTNKGLEPISIVGRQYKLIPHELIQDTLEAIITEEGFEIVKRYVFGKELIYTVLTDKVFEVDKDDKYRLGFSVRNSYSGMKAYNFSAFTYRYACKNGAYFGGKNLLKIWHKHSGNISEVVDNMRETIHRLLNLTDTIRSMLVQLKEIKVSEELILDLLKSTAVPDTELLKKYAVIVKDKNDGRITYEVVKVDSSKTAYDIFNDFTYKLTHLRKMNPVTEFEFSNGFINRLMKYVTVTV